MNFTPVVRSCALALMLSVQPLLAFEPEPLPYPRLLLTSVREVRRLAPDEAARQISVRLVGVVTHANPFLNDFFLQDETAGIYVPGTPLAAMLKSGDRVIVEGFTDPGDFAPCVQARRVEKLGSAILPEPQPFDLSRDESRWLDGQWVQVWCVVLDVAAGDGYTQLAVSTRRETGTVLIPGENRLSEFQSLRSASVRVRAVCVPRFDQNRVVSDAPRLFASAPDSVVVLRSASENRSPPVQLIDHLYGYTSEPHPGSRSVKVRGTVTARVPGGAIYLQDATGAVTVYSDANEEVRIGDEVEAVGFLEIHARTLILRHSQLQFLGCQALPQPSEYRRERSVPGTLVWLEGTVEDTGSHLDPGTLVVLEGGQHVECVGLDPSVQDRIRALALGSRVRVIGIYRGETKEPLLISTPDGLTVLRPPDTPSWWTPKRIFLVISGVAGMAGVSLFWNATLRRRVRRQTEEIRESYRRESELEARLSQSQKMEAIGRLAGGIAHDFNNLLTVINGCTELLRVTMPKSAVGSDLLDDVARAGEKAAALTSQLLILSKHRVMQLTATHLNECVLETVNLLRRIIGPSIEVRTDYGDHLPPFLGDKGMIHQILLNLAVNARDAMPGGGRLTVRTSSFVEGKTHWLRVSVADSGQGMDEATQTRIFEPFFTTKPVGQGTGLGLATVYGLVQAMGGRIHFESEVGVGTRFDIDLPPTEQPVAKVLHTKSGVYPTAKHSWHVLVVEDEPAVRRFVESALKQAGFVVLTADGPLEAIEQCRDGTKEFDLILTDLVMPEMTGLKLAETILSIRNGVPILFMSGYSAEELNVQGMNMDDWPFLQKPFPPSTLVAKIKEILNDSSYRLRGID